MPRVGVAALAACALSSCVLGARRSKSKHASGLTTCGTRGAGIAGNGTSINIVNGQPADECVWRWHLGMQRSTNPTTIPWCGAALISPEWAITAAHCVHRWTFYFDVVANMLNVKAQTGNEMRRKVVQVFMHPEYIGATKGNDFALLRLETPMDINECVGTVCLPEEGDDVPAETSCWITGWGSPGSGNGGKPDVLHEVSVDIISNDDCVGADYDYIDSQITPTMLCAQGRTEDGLITDACTGDSGGPLVCERNGAYSLYGATSWGQGCAGERHPGVWARIHSVLPWIEETLAANVDAPVPLPENCPFWAFRPNADSTDHCQCNRGQNGYDFCSLNGVDQNCPTSDGPGGRGGTRFLRSCTDCRCYPS